MRAIDADRLLEEHRMHTYYHLPNGDTAVPIVDIQNAPTVEPERKTECLTEDEIKAIRIHMNAFKERLCNQHRWKEAEEYQQIVDKLDVMLPQPEQRWIPCSERLPGKHGEMYLVTISDGAIYSAALQWDINRKRWYLSFLNNGEILIDYIDDVIAWMPLPECYRGENNG